MLLTAKDTDGLWARPSRTWQTLAITLQPPSSCPLHYATKTCFSWLPLLPSATAISLFFQFLSHWSKLPSFLSLESEARKEMQDLSPRIQEWIKWMAILDDRSRLLHKSLESLQDDDAHWWPESSKGIPRWSLLSKFPKTHTSFGYSVGQ